MFELMVKVFNDVTFGMVLLFLIYVVIGFVVTCSAASFMSDENNKGNKWMSGKANIPLISAGLGTLWFMMIVMLFAVGFVGLIRKTAEKYPLKIKK